MKSTCLTASIALSAMAALFTSAQLLGDDLSVVTIAPATPVAPAMAQTSAENAAPVSLAGDWRFSMDRDDVGYNEKWFSKDLTDKIKLPGILQGQGYGDDISTDTKWVLTLGGDWWTIQPQELRDHFSQPGHVEVPFLSQPAKHYLGVAWYQRDITIPDDWKDHRIVLFLERAHWQSTVFVDDKQYAYNDSLVAPHVTDLGVLTPGRHRLSIRVDNRTMLPAAGHQLDAHSVSDALGAAWNGIVGRIELSATTPVWIDDAQVFPDVAKKLAHVKIKIGNTTGQSGTGNVTASADFREVDGASFNIMVGTIESTVASVKWDAAGGSAEFDVPLNSATVAWDEYHAVLQHLTLSLQGGAANDQKDVTFGLREVSFKEKDLMVNGQLINLRMTHDGGEFPLTGYPSMDVASWLKIFQICKAYGLNGMRFHSWCPPEAAFTAADEIGFYLAPECGMWNNFTPALLQRLDAESALIRKYYGNHPSFLLLSPSNEPGGDTAGLAQWASAQYAQDNRRLYSGGTGRGVTSTVVQYASVADRGSGGWFGRDYSGALGNYHIPVLAHEVGQFCAYPDFDVIKKFTGFLRPSNYDIFQYIAQQHGLLDWNHLYAWASGRFQLECYKEELEANLRTPGLSGFQMLDLHDYLGQGTALIGVLDAFWQPKSYVTAAEFKRFAGPIVPLARLTKRTFTTADPFNVDAEIYNFGEGPLANSSPNWKIVDSHGKAVASGDWPSRDIAIGKNIPLGKISTDLSALPAPAAYKLVIGITGTTIENDWNFWLYPSSIDNTVPANVTVTSSWGDARTALAAGGKVLFLPTAADLDPTKSPKMANSPVFWNIQMTVRFDLNNRTPKFDAMLGLVCDATHPALAKFPTQVNCDWEWTPLVSGVPAINLDQAPAALHPIVAAIDDWNRNFRLGVIFECKVGTGNLLVSAINLANARTPGAQQLRRSLYDYMASDKFDPAVTLTDEQIGDLWVNGNPTPAVPAAPRTVDPDLNDAPTPLPPAATPAT